jgi:16S rRNA (guanine1207-N2)-methyltransferase
MPPDFDFAALRRAPDVEAENLFAFDAADRLILDEGAHAVSAAAEEVVVINDRYGALTLAAIAQHGARGVRTHQDSCTGELALRNNAAISGVAGFRSLDLGEELLAGARVVLMQLPKSLDALDEIAETVARHAHPSVTVVAGGRTKHMSLAMNEVLGRHFGEVRASLAQQKSRVIRARGPQPGGRSAWPRRAFLDELDLWVVAHGAAFAGAKLDLGTRELLRHLDEMKPDAEAAIDLGCGTGILATSLARRRPGLAVLATDTSAAAVASARATAAANSVAITVNRADGLSAQPDASADLVLLNPPFHTGSTVHTGVALRLFRDAARVLRPGGELWTVYNTHLAYRPSLARIVGDTREVRRTPKFTVTVSRAR